MTLSPCLHAVTYAPLWVGGLSGPTTLLIALLYPSLFGSVLSDQEFVLKYLYMPSKPNYFILET